jgi:hypothetical protein
MPATKAAKATTVIPGLPGTPFGETGSPGVGAPPKQHLVVETLSVQVDVTPPGTKIEAFVNYTCGGKKVQLFVPLTYAYTEPTTNFDFHVALQAVRLYVDPNTTIYVEAYAPGGSPGTRFLTVSGYLI